MKNKLIFDKIFLARESKELNSLLKYIILSNYLVQNKNFTEEHALLFSKQFNRRWMKTQQDKTYFLKMSECWLTEGMFQAPVHEVPTLPDAS